MFSGWVVKLRTGGVGTLVADRWVEKVIAVKKLNDRIIILY